MSQSLFNEFFQTEAKMFLLATIKISMAEDGRDMTSEGLFKESDMAQMQIVAKQHTIVAGVPLIPLILEMAAPDSQCHLNVDDGDIVSPGTMVAALQGPAVQLLRAERIILNFMCHLSGIAQLTREFVNAVEGTGTSVLDTRKTLPGLRYPEKYAVLVGGGKNHRMNLHEMLMLKDNHIDRAGGIKDAVAALRVTHDPCPPIEVECRTEKEVLEAVDAEADRIMLDNMSPEMVRAALRLIPDDIETEVSGGITLENIREYAECGPDYISVGRLTHSAPASDFSMQFISI